MKRCAFCGEKIPKEQLDVKVSFGHLFNRKKLYFHPICFFQKEDQVKEFIAKSK